MKPLPTLADEVFAVLPELLRQHKPGPLVRDVASRIGADVPSIRKAFDQLEADGRAKVLRHRRAIHLVAIDHPVPICIICRREFRPARKSTRTCSHSCARHLAWRNEDMRARHKISVKKSHSDPTLRAHLSKINRERCADPAVRRKHSDRNRKSWRNPVSRANRIVAIKEAWRGEKAVTRKEKAREKKLAMWGNPEWKCKAVAAMRSGRRGRFKRAVLAMILSNETIQPREIAPRVGLTVEQVKIIWRRAVKLGEIDRRPLDGRRRGQ